MRILLSLFLFGALLACTQPPSNNLSETEKDTYRNRGKEIAQSTFKVLSMNLSGAMQEGGVENAVQYCNLAAYPLVDSLSKVHQAEIRRTSLRVRNEKNQPTDAEKDVLNAYQEAFEKGEKLQPRVLRVGEDIAFYAPIMIQPLCLKCHGEAGKDISEADLATIRQLYPNDRAIGFHEGDLRGMWSIRFSNPD
jgi:hypothetical protein